MWVPVAVWQLCELLYTCCCYLLPQRSKFRLIETYQSSSFVVVRLKHLTQVATSARVSSHIDELLRLGISKLRLVSTAAPWPGGGLRQKPAITGRVRSITSRWRSAEWVSGLFLQRKADNIIFSLNCRDTDALKIHRESRKKQDTKLLPVTSPYFTK